MLKHLRHRLSNEDGIALIVALGVTVVLTIAVTTGVYYTSTNARSAGVSDKQSTAYALAEAGVNNALALLSKPTTNAMDKYALCPDSASNPPLPCVHVDYYESNTQKDTWSGTFTQSVATGTAFWTITSTGDVPNPSSPTAAHITRTLTATIAIVPTVSQPLNNPSWNYIFVRAPGWSGVALNGCDMTLKNGVNVTANLYVLGNLCFQNQAKMTSGKLFVKGSVDQQSSQNTIGASGAGISDIHAAMGCRYLNQSRHTPCVQGAGGGTGTMDNVWATTIDSSVTVVDPPTVDWNGWYLNASPGPYFPCSTPQAGEAANPTWSFDPTVAAMADSDANKLLYKNDNAGTINLTPATAYSCKTISGELSWQPAAGTTPGTLTIKGTVFIDGSAYISNGNTNLYSGAGVLYLSGSFLLKNSKLCPASSTSTCDTTKWNNQQDLFGVVANGNGSVPADSQVATGDSAQFVSAYMMGAVYATNAIDIGTTSTVDGPLDGSSVLLGQSSSSTFNGFTYVPVGLPGENTVYAQPQAPTFSGG